MIYFNKNDYCIPEIRRRANLQKALTKEDYYVYGLKSMAGNPPILVEYPGDLDSAHFTNMLKSKCTTLQSFFENHGVAMHKFVYPQDEAIDDDGHIEPPDYKIYIGLRRDLRENIPMACAVLKTIIFFCDGKLKITANTKIGSIPSFQ